MKQVYKDLFGQEYESKDLVNAKVSPPCLDASEISTNISVFELHNQDKELINQHLLKYKEYIRCYFVSIYREK